MYIYLQVYILNVYLSTDACVFKSYMDDGILAIVHSSAGKAISIKPPKAFTSHA